MDKSMVTICGREQFFVTERHADKPNKPDKQKKSNFFRRGGKLEGSPELTYQLFSEMYKMWLEYFNNVMQDGKISADERLLKLDYHGCLLLVSHAANMSMVGVYGFVVHESRQTFQLIGPDNRLKLIPKKDSVFQFVFNNKVYVVFGSSLQHKSYLRGKKPKNVGKLLLLLK
uniref:Ribonuclease P protein subunit p29 n=1 Tax=Rhabditophanes sp. KR3021 TaxID=114890 RepID=A0AC35U0F7_9BILA